MNSLDKIKADEEIFLFKHKGRYYEIKKDSEKIEMKDITQEESK